MGNPRAVGTIRHMYLSSRLRRFFIFLVTVAVLCAAFRNGYFIYNLLKRTVNDKHSERYSRQLEVERTNVQIWRLYMKQPFMDPRLSPINCSIVPRVSICAKVDFVVVVHVRADDAQSRTRWRNTYGAGQLKSKYNYTVLFSVGRPGSANHQRIIEEESALYDDILQFDFSDTYRNLTLKHLAELQYLAFACDGNVVLLKIDDDVGWDVQRVSDFTKNNLTSDGLYCARRVGHTPIRDSKFKWAVTKDEWNETIYPPHCPGWFYLVPISVVNRMLSVVHLQRFFWIDDVFITGVLPKAANISITNMDTLSGIVYYPKDSPDGKIAFLTEKKYFRHWFFVVNHERLTLK